MVTVTVERVGRNLVLLLYWEDDNLVGESREELPPGASVFDIPHEKWAAAAGQGLFRVTDSGLIAVKEA